MSLADVDESLAERGLERLRAENGRMAEGLSVQDVIKTFCDESVLAGRGGDGRFDGYWTFSGCFWFRLEAESS